MTLEEPFAIDFLALACHGEYSARRKAVDAVHPWVAYEVKVSRGDMRSELLNPSKRAYAMEVSHEFYFAVPRGLLKDKEIKFEEPGDLRHEHFAREPCEGRCHRSRGQRLAGRYGDWRSESWIVCEICGGKGYAKKSEVERKFPTLWIPKGCGLVEVTSGGSRIRKRAPLRRAKPISHYHTALLLRHGVDPSVVRNAEIKLASARYGARVANEEREHAVAELALAKNILAEALGGQISPGSRWRPRPGAREFSRAFSRQRAEIEVIVSDVTDRTVRYESPEWNWSPRMEVGDFLLAYQPAM